MVLYSSIDILDADFRRSALDAGFAAVIVKPVKSGHLLNAIKSSIGLGLENVSETHETAIDEQEKVGSVVLSILLVDDNKLNQKVGTKILQRLGYDPDVVGSGAEAIVACSTKAYGAVLMDIEMPEMDGITAATLIREKLASGERPYIVALTANVLASERHRYLTSGMDGYLSKPIDLDALTLVLKEAANFHRANRNENSIGGQSTGGTENA